jgi:hypothetical protein
LGVLQPRFLGGPEVFSVRPRFFAMLEAQPRASKKAEGASLEAKGLTQRPRLNAQFSPRVRIVLFSTVGEDSFFCSMEDLFSAGEEEYYWYSYDDLHVDIINEWEPEHEEHVLDDQAQAAKDAAQAAIFDVAAEPALMQAELEQADVDLSAPAGTGHMAYWAWARSHPPTS